jgi:SNW domain-containing protein 1
MDLASLLAKVPPKNSLRAKYGGISTTSSSSTALSIHSGTYDGKGLGQSLNSKGTLVVSKGKDGLLDTSLLTRVGRQAGDIVYGDKSALVERNIQRSSLARPTEEEADAVAAATAVALGQIVDTKITAARPLTVQSKGDEASHSKFVSYKPAQVGAVKQRVIRLVQEQRDPMEPPRHKHRKNPGGSAEAPVPILHSPPRKLTAEDQANWNIPPVISNWKNSRGFTISLDKRLVADGRGLIKPEVNNRHAELAEALFIAEKKAREEVNMRNELKARLAEEDRRREEEKLTQLAANARAQRAGAAATSNDNDFSSELSSSSMPSSSSSSSLELAALREREEIRKERRRELDRNLRTDESGNVVSRKRDAERDISEKIALGLGTGKRKAEVQYDERLFNQTGGLGSSLLDDGDARVYDKDLFTARKDVLSHRSSSSSTDNYGASEIESMYDNMNQNKAKRFKADKDQQLTGSSGSASVRGSGMPVKFEKAPASSSVAKAKSDEFSSFFGNNSSSSGSSSSRNTLSGVGNGRGSMLASSSDLLSRKGSSGRSIGFTKSSQ